MIRCSRCGADAPAGAAVCQRCGMPFNDMPVNMSQEQPALPAWLETLRADRRPTPQASQEASHPAHIQNAGDVPAWMRTGLTGAKDVTPPGSFPSQRSSAMPAPNTDSSQLPIDGMSAGSLIDEQSLPSWLRESPVAGQHAPQDNISASSLIQPEALPDWMRTMPPPQQPVAPPQSYSSTPLNRPQEPISGNDLIDPQALPPWMTNQPAASQPGQRFDAASLLDAGALPPWMREAQPPPQASAPTYPTTPTAQPAWQAPASQGVTFNEQTPPAQAMPNQEMSGQAPANGLSAASLIDMNALPDWLKPSDQQQGVPLSPTPYGSPGRAESMRVPSRPRSSMGMGPQEDSAVAANAFMSVLGVASAPNFPAQSPGQFPPSQPPANSVEPVPFASMSPQSSGSAMFGAPPAQALPSNQAMGMYAGYQLSPSPAPAQTPGGYQNGMSGHGAMSPFPMNAANMQPEQHAGMGPAKPAKPAKRGIFEALRDWLFR